MIRRDQVARRLAPHDALAVAVLTPASSATRSRPPAPRGRRRPLRRRRLRPLRRPRRPRAGSRAGARLPPAVPHLAAANPSATPRRSPSTSGIPLADDRHLAHGGRLLRRRSPTPIAGPPRQQDGARAHDHPLRPGQEARRPGARHLQQDRDPARLLRPCSATTPARSTRWATSTSSQVWQLSRHLGLPAQVVDKTPSADLWPGQTDEGELGFSYDVGRRGALPAVRSGLQPEEVVDRGYDERVVRRIVSLEQRSASSAG